MLSFSVTFGDPTTSAGADSGSEVNETNVPGASLGSLLTWLPSSPEVSEYDVGTAETLAYDADDAVLAAFVAFSSWPPEK